MPDPEVVPVKTAKQDWFAGPLNVIGLSIAAAALFVYAELLLTAQSSYWAGGSLQDWIETAQAFGIYATVLTGAALIPFCIIAPFLMISWLRQVLSVLLPIGAALGLCLYIDSVVEEIEPSLRLGVPAVLAGMAALALIFGLLRVAQPGNFALLVLIAVAGGIGTLYVSVAEHLLEPDRAVVIVNGSLLWFGASTVGALVLWLVTVKVRPRWAIRLVTSLVLCALYPAYLFAQPFFESITDSKDNQNVLLITIDTLRADYCSTYGGSVPTPNLDALAAGGVVFNRYYSLAPWTVPSINALMTSKYPPGLTPNAPSEQRANEERGYQRLAGYWLDSDGVTFTKRLGNVGYDTAAVYANPTIEFQEWLTHGFQGSKKVNDIGDRREPVRFRQTPILREVIGPYRPEFIEDRALDSSAAVTRFGLAYMRRRQADPFFLWLHFMDPHTPYDPPARFRQGETPWPQFPPDSATLDIDAEDQLTDEEKRAAQSLYEAEIQYVDDCVGRLLSELRRLGLEEETLVCLSSDHGEEFWEHRRWGHGYDLFDEQVRVPLILAGPNIMPNRINVPVSAIDVLPTIADLLGHGTNPEWHGTSLVPALSGGDEDLLRRPVFSQATHYFRYDPEPSRMVIDRNLKLIYGLETGSTRLYDLSDDPGEERDLADSMPEAVERLHGLLEIWSAGFPSDFNEVAGWRGSGQLLPADSGLDETLKSLGYVQ